MTCVMFCLKSKPALPWPVPLVGPPKLAMPVIDTAGPVPESLLATEP